MKSPFPRLATRLLASAAPPHNSGCCGQLRRSFFKMSERCEG
jgi:hypothetical protein